MAHIYKATEWDICGTWYCNDTEDLVHNSGAWWHPARILGVSPAEYVRILVTEFKPDRVHYTVEANVLIFSWKSQAAMRKYKRWINKKAREAHYIV